jgi:hypothetical protein
MTKFIYLEAIIKPRDLRDSVLLAIIMISFIAPEVKAGSRDQAYRLHNRLAGVPPSPAVLNEMDTLIKNGDQKGAALKAIDNKNFYDLVLKTWVKRWTNVDDSPRVPLNDYVATVVGIVRDDIPFDQVLYGDHLYIANPSIANPVTPYKKENNDHYESIDNRYLSLKDNLVRVNQSEVNGISDTAGVLTSRAAASAFFSAGTNRRMTRYTFMNYLCRDFEALHDINITDYHVRRDVERNPGGDSRTYKSQCVGCHAGQDALGGAWAHFDFVNNEIKYTPGVVVAKINKNNLFEDGYVTTNDEWVNLWANGQNASLGWPSTNSGKGARELGMMLSRSRAFAECMSTRVFELVCLRKPKIDQERKEIKRLADTFQLNANYNMKNLFAETSLLCMGE